MLFSFFFTFCFLGSEGLKSLFCFSSSFEATEDNMFTVLHGGVGDTAGAGKKDTSIFYSGPFQTQARDECSGFDN